MQHRSIRKVKVAASIDQQDSWRDQMKLVDTEAVRHHILARVSASKSLLIRWGGLASMAGGVLWVVFLLLLHFRLVLDMYVYVKMLDHLSVRDLLYSIDIRLLCIPLLLLIWGLGALHLKVKVSFSRLGKVGMLATVLGIILAIVLPFVRRQPEGLFNIISYFGWRDLDPIGWWFTTVQPALLVLAIGLILVSFATVRARARPTHPILSIAGSSIGMFLVSITPTLIGNGIGLFEFYEVGEWMHQSGVFVGASLWFGASWIWLGNVLRSNSFWSHSQLKSISPD